MLFDVSRNYHFLIWHLLIFNILNVILTRSHTLLGGNFDPTNHWPPEYSKKKTKKQRRVKKTWKYLKFEEVSNQLHEERQKQRFLLQVYFYNFLGYLSDQITNSTNNRTSNVRFFGKKTTPKINVKPSMLGPL